MKKFPITACMLLFSMFPFTTAAEVGAQSGDNVAEGRAMIRAGFRDIIAMELVFSEPEAKAFWPVYDEYEGEITAIMDRYASLIVTYVDRYDAGDLSDEYAAEVLAEYFSIRKEVLAVREAYIPRFKAVLPMLKVARLYQLENMINAQVDYRLASAIPLISE